MFQDDFSTEQILELSGSNKWTVLLFWEPKKRLELEGLMRVKLVYKGRGQTLPDMGSYRGDEHLLGKLARFQCQPVLWNLFLPDVPSRFGPAKSLHWKALWAKWGRRGWPLGCQRQSHQQGLERGTPQLDGEVSGSNTERSRDTMRRSVGEKFYASRYTHKMGKRS